jgi:hypothetical protein
MNLKTFLETNNVTCFDIIENTLILNVVDGEANYALDVDTSNIVENTPLIRVNEWTINENILSIGNLSLNIETTNLSGT